MSSLPPWKNVYKSGRWPGPNNNLLKACLPRHNASQSAVQPGNMATSLLNPLLFPHSTTLPTHQCCQPRDLAAFSRWPCPYYFITGTRLGRFFIHRIRGKAKRSVMPDEQCFVPKGRHLPFEKCDTYSDTTTPAWKWKWRLICLLLFTDKKAAL